MKIIFTTFVIITTLAVGLFGQDLYSDENLKSIYEGIEYKTYVNDLTGEKWDITEPWLIRQIIENLYNNDRFILPKGIIKDSSIVKNDLELIGEAILKNQVRIRCAKRFYDNNLASLNVLLDTIPMKDTVSPVSAIEAINIDGKELKLDGMDNWVEIKDGVTDTTYRNILTKNYQYIDLTRRDISPLKEQQFVLSIYKSELFLYRFNFLQNLRVSISAYFKLGNDYINLPSWYKDHIAAGLSIRCNPSKLPNRLDYELFGLTIGWDTPINFTIQRDFVPSFINDILKDRRLTGTSDNLFFGISYAPIELHDTKENTFLFLTAEASFPIVDKKTTSLALGNISEFKSIRDIWSLNGLYGNIWEGLEIGTTVSGFTVNNYSALEPTDNLLVLDSKHHLLLSFEPGISREDAPFYYTLSPQINFDITNGQKFFVFKSVLFFGTNIGLDFRYFISLNGDNTVPWHYKDYIVISPMFIIN
jgi:hypothetical protein